MTDDPVRQRARRRVPRAVVSAVLLSSATVLLGASAPAVAASSDPAAAVQQMLDRVLGPGHAIVRIIEHRQSGDTTVVSARSTAAGVPVATIISGSTGPDGSQRSAQVVNALPETDSRAVTPAGALQFEQVTVVLDRAVVPARSLGTLRALIAAAAGTNAKRGDTLHLGLVPFARAPQVRAIPAQLDLLPLVPAAEMALGLLLALGIVAASTYRAARRRRRRQPSRTHEPIPLQSGTS